MAELFYPEASDTTLRYTRHLQTPFPRSAQPHHSVHNRLPFWLKPTPTVQKSVEMYNATPRTHIFRRRLNNHAATASDEQDLLDGSGTRTNEDGNVGGSSEQMASRAGSVSASYNGHVVMTNAAFYGEGKGERNALVGGF